jgi:hypothetical protein
LPIIHSHWFVVANGKLLTVEVQGSNL